MSFQLVLEQVHIFDLSIFCVLLDPCLAMENANMNCGSCVCDNDSISIFRECHSNELIELLKSKKHARIFLHMLRCL